MPSSHFSAAGVLSWEGAPVGRAIAGETVLNPPRRSSAERSVARGRARTFAPPTRPMARGTYRATVQTSGGGGRRQQHFRRHPWRRLSVDRVPGPAAAPRAGEPTAAGGCPRLGRLGFVSVAKASGFQRSPGCGPCRVALVHQGGARTSATAAAPAREPCARSRVAGRFLSGSGLSAGRIARCPGGRAGAILAAGGTSC